MGAAESTLRVTKYRFFVSGNLLFRYLIRSDLQQYVDLALHKIESYVDGMLQLLERDRLTL